MAQIRAATIELSAGGVIYRREPGGAVEVLLIRDSYGNWGFPKGHLEAGESSEQAALRECREETGLEGLRVAGPVGTSDWYFWASKALVHKYCDYFLLEADPEQEAQPQRGEGIQACVWLDSDEAAARVTYANARQILRVAHERLDASRAPASEDDVSETSGPRP